MYTGGLRVSSGLGTGASSGKRSGSGSSIGGSGPQPGAGIGGCSLGSRGFGVIEVSFFLVGQPLVQF
jgi:hypothetical protein